eukprot:symbB.v1.2.006332.t1/scaffold378.1/size217351/10
MSIHPELMKECVVIMGTAGDIDEDLLLESGDGSPEKVMAALQAKLDVANERITQLTDEVNDLSRRLIETNYESEDRLRNWSRCKMQAEEAIQRLDKQTRTLNAVLEREAELQADYDDLWMRHVRASKMMIYKARQGMRDRLFAQNKKENLFYAFQGFMYIVQQEKEERIRREQEEMRDSVEFALRNEVRFLLNENLRCNDSVKRLANEQHRLKLDRRALAKRLLYRQRPYERLEYLKWVWELWQPLRSSLRLEKHLDQTQASLAAVNQQLTWSSKQMVPLMNFMDQLRMEVLREQLEGDLMRRELVAASARQFAALTERLRLQRAQEGGKIQRWGNKPIPTVKKRVEEAFPKMMNCQVKVKDEKIKAEGHIQNGTNGSSKTVERHTTCWHPSHPPIQPSHPPKLRQEVEILKRLRELENEAKDERIAVLEREIAEDKHIHALKSMIVDLEQNLRRALDRRKPRSFVVPPNGPKCVTCGRETSFRAWKLPPDGLTRSASEVDLSRDRPSAVVSPPPPRSPSRGNSRAAWSDEEKESKFVAVLRGSTQHEAGALAQAPTFTEGRAVQVSMAATGGEPSRLSLVAVGLLAGTAAVGILALFFYGSYSGAGSGL